MALDWKYTPVAQEVVGITQFYAQDHKAIDFNGFGEDWRGKKLFAGFNGKVTQTGNDARGIYVEITISLWGRQFIIGICHMDERFVKVGDTVIATTPVGTMGDTGEANGVHCHFYAVEAGERINPFDILFNTNSNGEQYETGIFICQVDDLRVRATPSLNGVIEGQCVNGKRYIYTKKTIADGYRWIYLSEWDTWTAWATEDRKKTHGVIE